MTFEKQSLLVTRQRGKKKKKLEPKQMSTLKKLTLKVCNSPSPEQAMTNCVFMNPEDASALTLAVQSVALPLQTYVLIRDFVYVFQPFDKIPRGFVGMSSIQRRNTSLALNDPVACVAFDPPDERVFLSVLRLEVDLLARPRAPAATGSAPASATSASAPTFSAPQLAMTVEKLFCRHFFTQGQQILVSVNDINLLFVVKAVDVTEMSSLIGEGNKADPSQKSSLSPPVSSPTPPQQQQQQPVVAGRGVLMKNTEIKVERAPGTTLRLTGAEGAGSGIGLFRTRNLNPESLGVGGLDKEFMDIVRRTLATRIFPPSLMEKLGMQHVKGMLLYGPPGTGKVGSFCSPLATRRTLTLTLSHRL